VKSKGNYLGNLRIFLKLKLDQQEWAVTIQTAVNPIASSLFERFVGPESSLKVYH
jgi:hypothetical protein